MKKSIVALVLEHQSQAMPVYSLLSSCTASQPSYSMSSIVTTSSDKASEIAADVGRLLAFEAILLLLALEAGRSRPALDPVADEVRERDRDLIFFTGAPLQLELVGGPLLGHGILNR